MKRNSDTGKNVREESKKEGRKEGKAKHEYIMTMNLNRHQTWTNITKRRKEADR